MGEEIRERLRELEEVTARAEAVIGDLDEETLNWNPAEGVWSVAQCVDHLSVTAHRYIEVLEPAIAEARQKGLTGEGPRKRSLSDRMLRWAVEPGRGKVKAPKMFHPGERMGRETLIASYHEAHATLRRLMEASDGLNLGKVRVVSPVTSLMRLTLGGAFEVITTHERRHLLQAEKVMELPGFPRKTGAAA